MRWLVLLAFAAPLARADLPRDRVTIIKVELAHAAGEAPYATLLDGQPLHVVADRAGTLEVETRGPLRIRGVVPARTTGVCVADTAPVRLSQDGDAVGYLPRGWCFGPLAVRGDDLQFADRTFALTFFVSQRLLTGDTDWARRFDPVVNGFTTYRVREGQLPLPLKSGASPYWTVPGGEWPLRSPFEEGDQALIEVLGELVVLKGWVKATTVHEDIFTEKDRVERTRERLTDLQRPGPDPRGWFRLKEKTVVSPRPAAAPVGEADRGTAVTVNRRDGRFAQVRFEPDYIGRRSGLRVIALLWVPESALEPLPKDND